MMKPIFTGLSPNTENDDVALAWRLLCMPWKWQKGGARERLEESMRNLLGVPFVFAFESGRTSLMVGLSSLGLLSGDEVLLQAYTCVAVPNAVRWAGGAPVYVDCDRDSLAMDMGDFEKKITPRSRVVILQHTFGNPGNLSELIRIAKKHNLIVIEDCAHTIGGTYQGRALGSWGDMAIFSFGRDKSLSSVFGGALVTRDPQLEEKIRAIYRLTGLPKILWTIQQLLHPIVCWLTVRTFSIGVGKGILFFAKKLHILSLAVLPEERRGVMPSFVGKKMPNALAELALHQFEKLNRYNTHRRHIAKQYEEALVAYPSSFKFQALSFKNGAIPLRYTIQVKNPDQLCEYARKQGIYLGDWYRQVIAPERVSYDTIEYVLGSCPNAEDAAQHSVNLPLDIHITDTDANRITVCIRSYVDRTRG